MRSKIFPYIFLVVLIFISCGGNQETSESNTTSISRDTVETVQEYQKTILFFGNSLTAGYGLDLEQAFPAIIQDWMDSLGYSYRVINAGLSGETTSSGVGRIDWVLRTVPDIFVLELGANDGLRGLPLDETSKNLQIMIDKVREVNPEVTILLAGMMVPPNLGTEYTEQFRSIYPNLAAKNQVALIPFLLEGVAGEPELNLADGIHPTPAGHEIVANTVWKHLQPLLIK